MSVIIPSVAIVTGGAQGIGKGIVHQLLQDGARVVIADMDLVAAEETAHECAAGDRVLPLQVDVMNEVSVQALLDRSLAHFGELEALVNNAGRMLSTPTPVEELALEDWTRILHTNLTGVFLCCKYAVPALREHRGGAILNIGSTRALQSEAHTEAYSASKGGVVALTHALAVSLGPRVRVNSISPGWIVTDDWKKSSERKNPELREVDHMQHPAGRAGRPQDIAELASFLLSSRAEFITGQNFIVDGGMTRRMQYAE